MSMVEIRVPEEQTEGTRSQVLRWLKGVGDEVAEHEPLIEIETDKVTVEVAAPATGTLREILKAESDEVAPGEVLGRLELPVATGSVGAAASADTKGVEIASSRAALETDESVDQRNGAVASDELDSPASEARHPHAGASAGPGAHGHGARGDLSPAVRRLIAERGLDISALQGSGPGGRITVDDVLAAGRGVAGSSDSTRRDAEGPASGAVRHAETKASSTTSAQSASARTAPSIASADSGIPSHTVPHTAVRKRIAEHMVQSLLHTAPHVTTVFEADMTAVMSHRAAHKADFESRGAPLTYTAYFLSAAAAALKAVPEANSRWTDSALELYDTLNIGVATAIEDVGLVVPVLRAVESKDLFQIAKGLNDLVTAARNGKLQPSDVRGGTFTISNHGISGSLLATPIVINQPQSAILGIGKLEKRLTVSDGDKVIARPKCYVTLTIDHRVMDGHRANLFLQTFVRTLETWPAQ